MRDTTRVYGLFRIFYAAAQDRFLMPRISNHLMVEAVIMHETKGFSCAIRARITVRENNRIAKRVWLIFTLTHASPFFSWVSRISHVFLILQTSRESSVARLGLTQTQEVWRLRLCSHSETLIADTRRLCNWEAQIACHTQLLKLKLLSSIVTINVSVYFIMSSDSNSDERFGLDFWRMLDNFEEIEKFSIFHDNFLID